MGTGFIGNDLVFGTRNLKTPRTLAPVESSAVVLILLAWSSSRFRATAAHHKIHDLVFLQEMQDLADGVREMMDKATSLKQLWAERAKAPGK